MRGLPRLVARIPAARLVAVGLTAFGVLSLVTRNAPALTSTFGLYVGLFVVVGLVFQAGLVVGYLRSRSELSVSLPGEGR